jgi:hypothetical protein
MSDLALVDALLAGAARLTADGSDWRLGTLQRREARVKAQVLRRAAASAQPTRRPRYRGRARDLARAALRGLRADWREHGYPSANAARNALAGYAEWLRKVHGRTVAFEVRAAGDVIAHRISNPSFDGEDDALD